MDEKVPTQTKGDSSTLKSILTKNTPILNKLKVELTNIREEYKSQVASKSLESIQELEKESIIEHGLAGGEFPKVNNVASNFSSLFHKIKKSDSFIKRGSINKSSSSEKINEN
jgi:hypothetical protein